MDFYGRYRVGQLCPSSIDNTKPIHRRPTTSGNTLDQSIQHTVSRLQLLIHWRSRCRLQLPRFFEEQKNSLIQNRSKCEERDKNNLKIHPSSEIVQNRLKARSIAKSTQFSELPTTLCQWPLSARRLSSRAQNSSKVARGLCEHFIKNDLQPNSSQKSLITSFPRKNQEKKIIIF